MNDYTLLESGGALGNGVGPLLIAKKQININELDDKLIAVPGENTTAHVLFSLAFPNAKRKVFKAFNEIEDAILNNKADAGVIIHENRFTYQDKGLHKLIDLGEFWEKQTQLPIPLGGIIAKKTLDEKVIEQVDALIKASVEFAFKNDYKQLSNYVKKHAQEMSERVMRRHIDLYVNDFSLALGTEGKKAVQKLLDVQFKIQLNKKQ